jgi:hypothetical protein
MAIELEIQGFRVLSVAVGASDALQLAGIIALGTPPRPEGGRAVLGSDAPAQRHPASLAVAIAANSGGHHGREPS